MSHRVAALLFVAGLLCAAPAAAQSTALLGYQGRLLRSDGTAATGTAAVMFSAYDAASGGSLLWQETQTLGLSEGYYSTFLGLVTTLPEGLFGAGDRWLEVRVGSETLSPRQHIGAVAFAVTAQSVRGGTADVSALKVGGQTVVDTDGRLAGSARYGAGPGIAVDEQTVSLQICAAGQVLAHDGTTWQCATPAGGTVTSVAAAPPLSVSNASTTPSISMVQAAANSSGYLSSTDWSAFNARYGASTLCGGDLSGVLAAPVVARLQSRPVAAGAPAPGQVLKWTGSQWEPDTDANSGGTVTYVTAQAPVAVWNGSSTPQISMAPATATADGYLASADFARFSAKFDASTQCGGDLAGAWESPVVARLQGVSVSSTSPSSGQVLRFDGSGWRPTSLIISDVGGLSSGYLDLSGNQSLSGTKTFATAPVFGTPLATASGGTGATAADPNMIFAGPAGEPSGAPAFRALAADDIPGLDASKIVSGTLGIARGGLGTTSAPANALFAGPASGSDAAPAFRAIVRADVPSLDASILTSGTLPAARLSGVYGQAVSFTNAGNAFTGDGSGLYGLNASAFSSGTVPDAMLAGTYSSTVVFSHPSNSFAGSFAGSFSGSVSGTFTGGATFTDEVRLPSSGVCGSDHKGAVIFNGTHFQGCDGVNWVTLDNVPPPVVSSVNPVYGTTLGGTDITILGSGFQYLARVFVGGTEVTLPPAQVQSTTVIVAKTPANAVPGAKDVTVQNPDNQSGTLAQSFNYHKPPVITSISTNEGPTSGGTSVTIAGTDFVATPTVTFGGTAATSAVLSGTTQIVAVAPAHAAGAGAIVVANPDLLSASVAFTYGTPGSNAKCALASCNALLTAGVSADGTYWIAPEGNTATAFQAYCDQTTNGGGWTLVSNVAPTDGNSVGYNNQAFWTTQSEYGSFANRFANDYKSPAAWRLSGSAILIESTGTGAGGSILGWRRWPTTSTRTFGSHFATGIASVHSASCATGNADAGSAGSASAWDDIIQQGTCLYTDVNPSSSGEADLIRLTTIAGNSTNNNISGFGTCIDCGTTWNGSSYPYMGLDRAGCNSSLCAYNLICRMGSADCLGNYCSATYAVPGETNTPTGQCGEGGSVSLSCSSGTILSYTSYYGANTSGCGPTRSCGSCSVGATSCSVTYNNSNCGDCAPGYGKNGNLTLHCGSNSVTQCPTTWNSRIFVR